MERDQLMGRMTHPTSCDDPHEALIHLAGGFFGPDLADAMTCVPPEQVPEPFSRLLVHHEHMTTVLGQYHGTPVALEVLEQRLAGDVYDRRILLRASDTQRVIEVGVARIDFRYTSDPVREEVLQGRAPLGEILIRHDVLRRIEPLWFFRCEPADPLSQPFGRPLDGPIYGRLGVIHCNGSPAIELLEVVTGQRASTVKEHPDERIG